MNDKNKEIRTLECQLTIREAAQDEKGESRTISGTAIVFNAVSEILDDWGKRFREIIKPEACTMEFLNSQDIKMNLLHERSASIARANKGKGNLRLWVDEKGVNFEFEAPKCDLGDRALELVRAGVYSGCSFEFYPDEYDEEWVGDNVTIIHHKFRAITALTLGMDPAYSSTTVNVRERYEDTPEAKAKKEEEQQKKAEEMEREMLRRLNVLRQLEEDDSFNY